MHLAAKARNRPNSGPQERWLFQIAISILLLLGGTGLSGCALGGGDQLVTSCVLPSDQSCTISGHWAATAVPIAFHQGDFAASEISAMTAAADSWNSFYGSALNMPAIDYGGSSPRTTAAAKPSACANSIISNGSFASGSSVGIYKVTSGWSHAQSAIAVTSFCTPTNLPAGSLLNFFNAFVEINYQSYFNSKAMPDLQSIVLHELGHVMGLNHSCEAGGGSGFADCNSSSVDPSYISAVMFPTFFPTGSGAGFQIKRSLNTNDQGRANCLYDGQLTSVPTSCTRSTAD